MRQFNNVAMAVFNSLMQFQKQMTKNLLRDFSPFDRVVQSLDCLCQKITLSSV